MHSRKVYLVVLFVLVASILLPACQVIVPAVQPTETPDPADEIQGIISATGEVVPAQFSTLSMSAAGVIEAVLVEEGQQVKKDDVLIRLEGQDSLKAAVAAAEMEQVAAQQALDDLHDNWEKARAAAQLRLANADKALDKAKDRRESKDYVRADQALIDQAKAELIMAKDAFKTAEDQWSYFEGKDEEDVNRAYALAVYSNAKKRRDQAEWNLNYLESLPDSLEVNVSEGELVTAKAEMDAAQRDWERVKNGPDARQLTLIQTRVNSAQTALEAARKALDNLELKAPFEGTVSRLYPHVKEWASPGVPMLILADLRHLRVETTDLNEIDAAQLQVNDLCDVTFDALPDVRVLGKVARIGTKSAEGSGVTYTVVVELAEIPDRLRWGMTAFVDVKIED